MFSNLNSYWWDNWDWDLLERWIGWYFAWHNLHEDFFSSNLRLWHWPVLEVPFYPILSLGCSCIPL